MGEHSVGSVAKIDPKPRPKLRVLWYSTVIVRTDQHRLVSPDRAMLFRLPVMKQAGGTLLYRQTKDGLEVLLVHPSGNYNRKAPWSIPKGEADDGEEIEATARRAGFDSVEFSTAYLLRKPVAGQNRTFPVFLMVARAGR